MILPVDQDVGALPCQIWIDFCAVVMAAAPSAATGATGATGLERLLLIFLMKLSESQNAANNTYFSYD